MVTSTLTGFFSHYLTSLNHINLYKKCWVYYIMYKYYGKEFEIFAI